MGEAEVEPKKVKMRWVTLVARLLSQISDVGEMKFVVRDRLLLLAKAGSKHPYSILLLTLSESLMLWVLLLGLCSCAARLVAVRQPDSLPQTRTVNLLAVLSIFALSWFGLSIGLLDSMLNLLAIACALKLIQLNNDSR